MLVARQCRCMYILHISHKAVVHAEDTARAVSGSMTPTRSMSLNGTPPKGNASRGLTPSGSMNLNGNSTPTKAPPHGTVPDGSTPNGVGPNGITPVTPQKDENYQRLQKENSNLSQK